MTWRAGRRNRLVPTWFWILVIGIPAGTVAWWFLRWFFLPSYRRTEAVEIDAPRSEGIRLPLKRDDFQAIKGIGPKTASTLYRANLQSYEQLALLDLDELVNILKSAGLRSGGAAFWQQQAALAAAEKWEELEKLQG